MNDHTCTCTAAIVTDAPADAKAAATAAVDVEVPAVAATPVACDPAIEDCTLVYPGGAVKALGDGKVGGMVVRFGLVDPQGDEFTAETDFWLADGQRVPIVYHHGLGGVGKARTSGGTPLGFGRRRIGWATARFRPDGIEAEDGLIDLTLPGAVEFYEDIKADRVGWSSGSSERLVEPSRAGSGVRTITQWPINEISLTYTPVERKNRAVALKAIMAGIEDGADVPAAAPPTCGCGVKAVRPEVADRALGDRGAGKGEDDSPYGKCPICGAPGVTRERRINGNDLCASGHEYPSRDAVKSGTKSDPAPGGGQSPGSTSHESIPIEVPVAGKSIVDCSARLVADATELLGSATKAADQRRTEGRAELLNPEKREAIKAAADALAELHARTAPTPLAASPVSEPATGSAELWATLREARAVLLASYQRRS